MLSSGITYYLASPFFIAHVAVGALALILLARQFLRVRTLRVKSSSLQRITETEFNRYKYRVERFDQYFDYCASVFIFVGLLGTMYGFIQAIPYLPDPKYDFHHFRDALTVSGSGIVWSVVLMGLVSFQ